jgi:para-nitrobenzyl esterase
MKGDTMLHQQCCRYAEGVRYLEVKRSGSLLLLLAFIAVAAIGCGQESRDQGIHANLNALGLGDGGARGADGDGAPKVWVESGKLQGKLVGTTREFLGIPYAKAPVGKLRFAPPRPAEYWKETRDATAFGPSCPQNAGALSTSGAQSEDCLTLNVFSPASEEAKRAYTRRAALPVMVFIHGGAFVSGGSSQYDAQKLSEAGHLVVVTVNYRLGVLGFLAHPELDKSRAPYSPSGNDAIRDQQLALLWVQRNVGAFGGDASNVTIFGESAGSASTCIQMVSPISRYLGHRFIMESGVCIGGLKVNDKATADTLGTALGNEICAGETDVIACLRSKSAQELIVWRKDTGLFGAGWGPSYNPKDPVLPAKPADLIANGNYNKGPIIVGTNKNEWGLFQLIGISPNIASAAQFGAVVDAQFGAASPLVKAHYAVKSDAEANAVFVRLMTDTTFRCPTRGLARLTTAKGSDVYLYSFEEGYAMHAFELPYVFGSPNPLLAPVLVESLRAAIQGYFTQFAASGDPNRQAQPTWPVYDPVNDPYMTLKETSEAGSGLSKDDCDFWDSLASG